MLKFKRHKSVAEIAIQCNAQGVYLDRHSYDQGGDTICVGAPANSGSGWAVFNTFNGRFWGRTPEGMSFSSDSPEHDGEPWMQALLHFFMVPLAGGEQPDKQPATMVDYALGGPPLLNRA